MNTDIQLALDAIHLHQPSRQTFIDYYEGRHRLAFATDKFKTAFAKILTDLRENQCPVVVEAPADRMEVINFSGENENDAIAAEAWKLWQRELMELRSNEVHVEALKTGSAYLIVWEDLNVPGKAKLHLQDSRNCCIIKSEETGDALFGAKMWNLDDKRMRLTLYYPDRDEKYITEKPKPDGLPVKAEHFVQVADEPFSVPNRWGVIPMFEFQARAVLMNVIPLQDKLNKIIADEMVAGEYQALPQRYITGIDPPIDEATGRESPLFQGGAAHIWWVSDAAAKMGQFDPANMIPFLDRADATRLSIAQTSKTPLTYFLRQMSDAMSGEALKTLEAGFTKKVKRLCLSFGAVWSEVMSLALAIEGKSITGSLTAQWEAPEQRSESELLDSQLKKQTLGVPNDVLLEELGYTPEDIARFADPVLVEPEVENGV
jgi:hypothetical protein